MEGYIDVQYDFKNKNLKTNFEVSHLKLNDAILNDIFSFDLSGGLSLSGKGLISKSMFSENAQRHEIEKTGELFFNLKAKNVGFKHWGMSELDSQCDFIKEKLSCDISVEEMNFSEMLTETTKLEKNKFIGLGSKNLVFEKDELKFSFNSIDDEVFEFHWQKDQGLLIRPDQEGAVSVKLRELD